MTIASPVRQSGYPSNSRANMPKIRPFKAIRPTPDKVAFVASRSYEEYSKKELEANLSYNPFSFLHIINPGFKYDKRVTGNERFRLVRNRYMEFLEDQVFQKDADPSIYIYRVEKNAYRCTGFFCATSVEDYESGIIKKHEATIARREKLFADYLEIVRFEAEPVLMAYEDNKTISDILTDATKETPTYEFTTPDRIKHSLWVISDSKTLKVIQDEFSNMDSLYIADGHHRSASSCLLGNTLRDKNPQHVGNEAYNYFMSYLIPESDIRIFEFNRMVKDLNGLSKKRSS